MNPTTLVVITGIVVIFGEWTHGGLQARTVIGLFVVTLMLNVLGSYDPHLANLFGALILLGAVFRYGVPFTGLSNTSSTPPPPGTRTQYPDFMGPLPAQSKGVSYQ